jgi:hypothetical protein
MLLRRDMRGQGLCELNVTPGAHEQGQRAHAVVQKIETIGDVVNIVN